MTSGTAPEGAEAQRVKLLEIAATSADALIREILEALCRRDGLPLESSVVAGEPARNYDLAMRLGIGRVFGISEEKPEAPALPGVTRHRKSERRQRSVLVSVRLLPHELEIVQALACAAGMEYSVSGYLRKTALDQAATAGEEKAPAVPSPPVAAALDRESLGRIVHEQRLACEAERAALEGRQRFNLKPWEQRTYEQQETDMRTGEAVAAAVRSRSENRAKLAAVAAYCEEHKGDSGFSWMHALDILEIIGGEGEQ